jgi:hypothetical protein
VRRRTLVFPGHPLGGSGGHLLAAAQERDQVIERLDVVEFGGVDQAHEDVADVRTVERLVEERVLSAKDGLLQQSPFATVVVSAGLAKEERQLLPVRRSDRLTVETRALF